MSGNFNNIIKKIERESRINDVLLRIQGVSNNFSVTFIGIFHCPT